MIYYNHERQRAVKPIFRGINMMFYELIKRASWVKIAEAWTDLKAAGTAAAEIYWIGGEFFAMVEDVPSNPRTFIADSFSGLFTEDNYTFFKEDEFKKI